MSKEILLEPHFEGERFRNHTLPLSLLRDVEALQGIILEIAKDNYRESHPTLKRLPPRFSDRYELHMSARQGSFVAEIALIAASTVPPAHTSTILPGSVPVLAAPRQKSWATFLRSKPIDVRSTSPSTR